MLPGPLAELPGVLCYLLPEGLHLPIRPDVQVVAEDLAGRVQRAVFAEAGASIHVQDAIAAIAILDFVREAGSEEIALEVGPPSVH